MASTINASTSSGLVQTADTSGILQLQTANTTALTIDASQNVTLAGTLTVGGNAVNALTLSTAQASTSGTAIQFTGIPSWVKRITVIFDDVSTSGASKVQVQLGTSSGYTTSGYTGSSAVISSGVAAVSYTSGFVFNLGTTDTATANRNGHLIITKIDGNTYVASGMISATSTSTTSICGYNVSLAATLDRVRVTSVSGTDTFDAGTINVMYEG